MTAAASRHALPAAPRAGRHPWRWIVLGVAGAVAGLASALAVGGGALGDASLSNNGWSTNLTIGSTAANPWIRARVARVGLLALTREETVYFDRATDQEGSPLREDCAYRISGPPLPARWWSVTLYDGRDMLPPNADGAMSVDATRLAGMGEAWSATIAPRRPDDGSAWLSSNGAGRFALTLRLYHPASATPEGLAAAALPRIARLSCGGGA
jgi:hypothetical protein